jgi:hypothetical protein
MGAANRWRSAKVPDPAYLAITREDRDCVISGLPGFGHFDRGMAYPESQRRHSPHQKQRHEKERGRGTNRVKTGSLHTEFMPHVAA